MTLCLSVRRSSKMHSGPSRTRNGDNRISDRAGTDGKRSALLAEVMARSYSETKNVLEAFEEP